MLAGLQEATPEQRQDIERELAGLRNRLDRFSRIAPPPR